MKRASFYRPAPCIQGEDLLPHLLVLHLLLLEHVELDSCVFEHLPAVVPCVVAKLAYDALHPCVDEELRAVKARLHAAIDCRSICRGPVLGCLRYRVRLCMCRPNAVHVLAAALIEDRLHEVADLIAGRKPRWRTHIPCRDDALVFDKHRGRPAAVTIAALRDRVHDLDEVLVPLGALVLRVLAVHEALIRCGLLPRGSRVLLLFLTRFHEQSPSLWVLKGTF